MFVARFGFQEREKKKRKIANMGEGGGVVGGRILFVVPTQLRPYLVKAFCNFNKLEDTATIRAYF